MNLDAIRCAITVSHISARKFSAVQHPSSLPLVFQTFWATYKYYSNIGESACSQSWILLVSASPAAVHAIGDFAKWVCDWGNGRKSE